SLNSRSCIQFCDVVLLFCLILRRTPRYTLFPYTTLFRSRIGRTKTCQLSLTLKCRCHCDGYGRTAKLEKPEPVAMAAALQCQRRSEEHTSELQSQSNLVCRLLLEKKNMN